METDFELLEAWSGGSRGAGDALIERHFDSLCRFFRSKLASNPAEVEDLIQRTLLDCAESVARIEGASFRAYLFAVARHRLFDHLRARERRTMLEIGEISIVDLATSPSQRVARAEEGALVVDALKRLPLDFQITLELRYWEQLSDEEIGQVLGVSAHTVRSRLSRGRGLLREALEGLASEGRADRTLEEFLGKKGD